MDSLMPRTASKPSKAPPPHAPAEEVDIYVWKPARPLSAKSPKAPPPHEPAPSGPIVSLSSSQPSWPRIWRTFLAGAIIGLAVTKAAELLLKRDKPRLK